MNKPGVGQREPRPMIFSFYNIHNLSSVSGFPSGVIRKITGVGELIKRHPSPTQTHMPRGLGGKSKLSEYANVHTQCIYRALARGTFI